MGSPTELAEKLEHVAACFESSECQLKNARIMTQYFNFIELEVTWLDEVAEGLKNTISAANRFRNFVDGLPVELLWKTKLASAHNTIVQTMRQSIYTMGVVAHKLINSKKEDEEDKEAAEKRGQKIDFSKLLML